MAFVGYEQVAVSTAMKTASDLTIPAKTQRVLLQAELNEIRYTLDGSTAPTTTSGMLMLLTDEPLDIAVDDLLKIKFIRDGSTDAALNVHYAAGRNV